MAERRLLAIVETQRSWTCEEWVCHWVWQYLVDEINVVELELKLDQLDSNMPGALDPWPNVDRYFEALADG